jgi:ATP-dependent DNA ligase
MPADGVFDGELVSFDSDGRPDFPAVCHRHPARFRNLALGFAWGP